MLLREAVGNKETHILCQYVYSSGVNFFEIIREIYIFCCILSYLERWLNCENFCVTVANMKQ